MDNGIRLAKDLVETMHEKRRVQKKIERNKDAALVEPLKKALQEVNEKYNHIITMIKNA